MQIPLYYDKNKLNAGFGSSTPLMAWSPDAPPSFLSGEVEPGKVRRPKLPWDGSSGTPKVPAQGLLSATSRANILISKGVPGILTMSVAWRA